MASFSKNKSLSKQVGMILDDYNKEVVEASNKAIMSVSRKAVQQLKATSPKRPGHGQYAQSWASKKLETSLHGVQERVVYNRDHYRLTHLLENGHAVYNKQGGPFGRANGIKHIKPVEDWCQDALPKEVKKRL